MITKAQAGYVCSPGSDYLCQGCQFRRDDSHCAYFGPAVPISFSEGSCNRWKIGAAITPWLEPYLTKVQLGYVENKNGFGCRRCSEFKIGKDDCEVVERGSPGFTPGIISPEGCCDFQQPDKKRGQMTNQELVQILKPAAHTPVLRFRQRS